MSMREGQAPGGATLTSRSGRTSTPDHPRGDQGRETSDSIQWEELYLCLSEEERQKLFALASEQGRLCASQLPEADAKRLQSQRQWLQHVLNGRTEPLPSLTEQSLSFFDPDLSRDQQQAVTLALSTPDLFLIEGHAGTGKTRTVVEIARQALKQGLRTLLLAVDTPALDRALQQLADHEGACALRCLAAGEQVSTLPEEIKHLTLEARERFFHEKTVKKAQAQVSKLEKGTTDHRSTDKVWDALARLAECQTELDARIQAFQQEKIASEDEWDKEIESIVADPSRVETPFHKELAYALKKKRETVGKIEKQIANVEKNLQEKRSKRESIEKEIEELVPLVDARDQGRWWTPKFWKARFQKDLPTQHQGLIEHLEKLQTKENELNRELDELENEKKDREEHYQKQYEALLEKEKKQRTTELGRKENELEQEATLIRLQWEENCALLDAGIPRPESVSEEALKNAQEAWSGQMGESDQKVRQARRWASCLKNAARSLPSRLSKLANLVAATPNAFFSHPHLGEKAQPDLTFDLVIIEEAERISEADLVRIARHARRLILVGAARDTAAEENVFHRLLNKLDPDPRQLPVRWSRKDDQLCCQLTALRPEQEQWIESEPVADQEDIELRILADPDEEPRLAEVRFPADTTIQFAKEYLYKELEELTAQMHGTTLSWQESDEQIEAHFSEADQEPIVISLEKGVCELVCEHSGSAPFDTIGFRFARAEGWDREKAEQWITEKLGLVDQHRSIKLEHLYRMPEELGTFARQLLYRGEANAEELTPPLERAWKSWRAPVGFVHVPALAQREGESLELDLANPDDVEKIPDELRSVLPKQGLVNLEEARAIVKAIETLLADPVLRADAQAWHDKTVNSMRMEQAPKTLKRPMRTIHSPTIAVTALYPTQALLIQHLLRQSRELAQGDSRLIVAPAKPEHALRTDYFALLESPEGVISIEVDVPEAFRQRECFLMILGLTRSHAEREIQWGQPELLPLALTRPSGRLLLFGDRMTLDRCQAERACGDCNAPTFTLEQSLASRLVNYLSRHQEHSILEL